MSDVRPPESPKLRIGDRVRCTSTDDPLIEAGDEGVIVNVAPPRPYAPGRARILWASDCVCMMDATDFEVIICGTGPKEVIRRESRGVKWCYVCRKRVEFWFTLTRDAEPSYYDPNPSIECERGHENGDLFPGYEREWE